MERHSGSSARKLQWRYREKDGMGKGQGAVGNGVSSRVGMKIVYRGWEMW